MRKEAGGGWQRVNVRDERECECLRGRKREEVVQWPHKWALVWVAIQIEASPVPPLVHPFPSLAIPFPFQVVSPRQSSGAAGELASRNLSLVENHRGNKVKAPSGTSHHRIPNRNYGPHSPRTTCTRIERIIDSHAKSKGARCDNCRRAIAQM